MLAVACCTPLWSAMGAATATETIELAVNALAARVERRRIPDLLSFLA
jgi:hypothetical protein